MIIVGIYPDQIFSERDILKNLYDEINTILPNTIVLYLYKLLKLPIIENDLSIGLDNGEHVETVVMLSHKKTDSVINVKVEFGEGEGKVPLDNIAKRAAAYKPNERVTYKMIKEYIEAKYGFKVHTAYIAEVKRELGLSMYDATNAVEELKQPRKPSNSGESGSDKGCVEAFCNYLNNKLLCFAFFC